VVSVDNSSQNPVTSATNAGAFLLKHKGMTIHFPLTMSDRKESRFLPQLLRPCFHLIVHVVTKTPNKKYASSCLILPQSFPLSIGLIFIRFEIFRYGLRYALRGSFQTAFRVTVCAR